ncbi:MAG: hypothetical protein HN742_13295 [Lentisphaerae bacterium]|jgi:hypothetical protein|nr:hypothetical protein [Lentisphaerota bacterium]MBT4819890.1 hypothetical protein [Lentisphaerota bacterium]MBT5608189.1 hypothetical protein [Lentisphaerota bacterium]MBT7058922.1 hypothetical protein [Lentisphaerota bacterium]MBT7842847.1 hypothetical protein [Lentisphaerota bacterium]
MTDYENWRATVTLGEPAWMPYNIGLTRSSWANFGAEQEKVVLSHPETWPHYQEGQYERMLEGPWSIKEDPTRDFVDQWGCVWRTTQYGFVGTIVEHPLSSEEALRTFTPPPAETYNGGQTPADFERAAAHLARMKRDGGRPMGGLDHGYFLLRLEYLRGFENLMCDLIEPSDDFMRLYNTVHALNRAAVQHWIDAGAELISLPEDLGGQDRSLIGPTYFRRWALPCYKELHEMVHQAGGLTYFHCDGNIMDISDQILEIEPDVFNPQDRANGIDALAETFKGRMCLALDFDRQHALPFGSPQDIADLLEYEVRTLGSANGGLMVQVEIRGDVPPDNLDAVAASLERLKTFWFED